MSIFFVDSAVHGDCCELTVSGQIDLSSADEVAAVGSLGLTEPRVRRLIVRLKGVTFIDSTGIGALVRIRNIALEFDKPLVLSDPSDRVLRLLEMSGLDKVFTIEPAPAPSTQGDGVVSSRADLSSTN